MKTPYAACRGESVLSPAEATLLLGVVDEFREWICWKYGDKIRDHCWENNISESDVWVDDEDNSF
jgi:hypothetical protein